jgi:predicted enzyme related to lactoylglutathione lyase
LPPRARSAEVVEKRFGGAGAVVCRGDAIMAAPVVFFDIAAPELASQVGFYSTVFGWEIGSDGGFAVPVSSPLRGNLRVEPPSLGPATERVVYIGVPDITAALAMVTANGGQVVFPRTPIPGVVVVAMFTDPAGNRMGLVEMDGESARIP